MDTKNKVFGKFMLVLVMISVLLTLGAFPVNSTANEVNKIDSPPSPAVNPTPSPSDPRGQPVTSSQTLSISGAPGYCSSVGGSINFESISSVTLTPNPDGTMKLVVQVYIANPTGCTAGEPCPEYDTSPEYVNVWIDWDGDKNWDTSEKVMDKALTGYMAINYYGTMTAISQFSPPSSVTSEPTWLRANLGWNHDPNDPCEYSWEWGNVVDQQVHLAAPEINDITVEGCKWSLPIWPYTCVIGTPGRNPQTGSKVRLEADIEVPAGYEVTKCSWTGDLTPGEGKPNNNCLYEYTPNTGAGPAVNTYGEKNVTLTIAYRHKDSGTTGQASREHTYKVFFEKTGDDDGDSIPNWVEYWGDDGAVPAMNDSDVYYNPSLSGFGRFTPSNGHIEYGPSAAGSESQYTIPSAPNCPGASLGGGSGIDEVALTIAHEKRHKEIWSNWQPGGIWVGWTDSDEGKPSASYDDDLPDDYEINVTHTATDTVDSCNLGSWPGWGSYKYYGDNEFQARLAEIGVTGIAYRDWANPGKQTNPPFVAVEQVQVQASEPTARTGPASPNASYSANITLVTDMAELTGSYSDAGVDTDSDGLYDNLRLSAGVQVTDTATYNLVAWLENSVGTGIAWASTQMTLSPGIHTVNLYFDGLTIRASGIDGPYSVARVELRAADDELLFDADDNAHTTAAYSHTNFDSPDAAFTGSFNDMGIDTNSDSLYDFLRVNMGLDVAEAGSYTIIGELENSDSIAVARTTASLSTGRQTVQLDFDGQLIFQHRQDGPYHLKALRVEDSSGNRVDFRYDAYTTGAYAYSQFQHGGTTINTTSYSDQGLDMNGDGNYDYLRIEFQVQAIQEGNHRVLAVLKDSQGRMIANVVQNLDLLAGPNTISLDFPGSAINRQGINGPYQVASVALLDENGAIVDYQQLAHITQAYSYTDFSPQLVSLAGNYQDYGRDTDNNGLYNYLDIDISVIPGDSGVIVAQGRLVDSTGQTIEWAESNTEMTAGTVQTITLSFTGNLIFANRKNGPFEIRNLIVYHTGDPGQSVSVAKAHSTAAYSYLDFEGASRVYLPIVLRR